MRPSDPSLPRMLGRYALYEKIAAGGMATVHIGRLLGPVGFARTVAIKRMHPHVADDPEFVSMFLDEARLAARIRHPNVVPTLDVVAMENELFLVMEYVLGESLARLMQAAATRGERIPPSMVATIMAGVLHGLHAAHEATSDRGEPLGIVHRDVSPQNILVGTDGVARVLDFGVAKAAGRIQTTREGQLKGKLAYMAPEQIRGKVSRTADVYAASVVLWEALTGKRLFRAENEAQLLDRVLRGCNVPPSKHVAGLPPALDEATMRGLNVNPAKRFATAREMARTLEEAIAPSTTSVVGDWVTDAAKEALDARHARIASIEGDSAVLSPSQTPAVSSETFPTPTKPAIPEAFPASAAATPLEPTTRGDIAVTDDMILTQLSSGSGSSPGRPSLLGRSPRRMWLGAVGAALLLGMVVVASVSRHSIPASRMASAIPGPSSPDMPALAASALATPSTVSGGEPSTPDASTSAVVPSDLPNGSAFVDPTLAPARYPSARRMGQTPGQVISHPPATPSSPAKAAYNPLEHL